MVLHSPRRGLLPGKDRCPDTAFPSSPRSGATPRRLQGRPFTPREPRDASRWLETRPAKQKERRKGRAPPQPHPAGRTCLRLLHSPARRRPRDLRPAPPGPLAWLLPPRRPFFLPPWESQDRSARDPSARPRPPAFQTLLGVSSRPVIITSNERDGLRGPTRPPTAAVRPAVRGGRAAPLGTLFRGGGCGQPRPFHAGGGAVRPRWRRPVGWRNCEVNS